VTAKLVIVSLADGHFSNCIIYVMETFALMLPFEMRTVLSGICLLIDNLKLSDNIFI